MKFTKTGFKNFKIQIQIYKYKIWELQNTVSIYTIFEVQYDNYSNANLHFSENQILIFWNRFFNLQIRFQDLNITNLRRWELFLGLFHCCPHRGIALIVVYRQLVMMIDFLQFRRLKKYLFKRKRININRMQLIAYVHSWYRFTFESRFDSFLAGMHNNSWVPNWKQYGPLAGIITHGWTPNPDLPTCLWKHRGWVESNNRLCSAGRSPLISVLA